MRNKIKANDFDFEYTGSVRTEKEIIENGYTQLTGKELFFRIVEKTIYGDYLMGYKFVTDIYKNGTTEGVNNVGAVNFGKWSIDSKDNSFSIEWDNGWDKTTTNAYDVNGNIEFYDKGTGKWRTTFKNFKSWK